MDTDNRTKMEEVADMLDMASTLVRVSAWALASDMELQTFAAFALVVVVPELMGPLHHDLCDGHIRSMNHRDFSQLLCASQVLNSYWVGA